MLPCISGHVELSLPCIALLYLCVHDVTQQARKRVKFQRPSKYAVSHTAAEHCTGADDDFHGDSKSPFSTLFVFLFYHLFMKRWYIETYRSSAELSRFTHTEKDISRYFKHKDVVIFLLSIEFLRWKQADRRKQISLHKLPGCMGGRDKTFLPKMSSVFKQVIHSCIKIKA